MWGRQEDRSHPADKNVCLQVSSGSCIWACNILPHIKEINELRDFANSEIVYF